MSASCPIPQNISLNYHLYHTAKVSDDLRHLITDISRAAKYISYAIQTTDTGLAGSSNESGEDQLKLDVLSDEILRQYLCESHLVCCYASEEQDGMVQLHPEGKFSVGFDPLDGSSLVDTNFAIGTIVGIYEGPEILGKTPRDQVAALYVLYGPRTVLVYSTGTGVHEFILNDVGEFIHLKDLGPIAEDGKNYSPGNLRALSDNAGYKAAMDSWISEEKTLRYSGCMVPDVHHILRKGQGLFTNVGGSKYPNGKLRLVYECGPFAYIIENAGGASSDGTQSLLDIEITELAQRTPIIVGSKNEVEKTVAFLNNA